MIEEQGFVLSEGYEKLKDNLINSIANPLFIKDINHTWIMFNSSFCDIINVTSEDILGKSDHDIFSKEEADIFWEKDDEVLKTGNTNINEEILTNINGEKFTILTSKVRIKDEKGNYYILGTITDVTEMKYDEIQLEKKNLQINAQKNEIKNAVTDLHYNTKQNLEIVSQIIESLSDKIEEFKAPVLLKDLKNWLNSMMLVHQFFSDSYNIKKITLISYIDQLSKIIPDVQEKTNLLIDGDPIVLSIRHMAPIGLIITELLQASILENKVNAVIIVLKYNEHHLDIDFQSGHQLIEENDAKGNEFGLWDLLNILVKYLDGTISLSPDRKKLQINIYHINALHRGKEI